MDDIGMGIAVLAVMAWLISYEYLKRRGWERRMEFVHAERLAAMEKGIPLPELPIDPPLAPRDPRVPLIVGVVLTTFGGGTMITLALLAVGKNYWAGPLPVTLVGVGLMLYYFLSVRPEYRRTRNG
jgi:hypothetical protein